MSAAILTLTDPACRAVRARQRRQFRALRRAGKAWLTGYRPPEGAGVERLWRAAGWAPSDRPPALILNTAFDKAA